MVLQLNLSDHKTDDNAGSEGTDRTAPSRDKNTVRKKSFFSWWRWGKRKEQDPEASSSSSASIDPIQHNGDDHSILDHPTHIECFEKEIEHRIREIAERRTKSRRLNATEQQPWIDLTMAKLREKYISQFDQQVEPNDASPKFEGSITYLSKALHNTSDSYLEPPYQKNLALDNPEAIQKSLHEAHTQWQSQHTLRVGDANQASHNVIRWIHVPANNMHWIESIMPHVIATSQHAHEKSLSENSDWEKLAKSVLRPEFWRSQCRVNDENPIFSRALKPFATCIHINSDGEDSRPEQGDMIALAAFMPYLHWESSIAATYMRHVVEDVQTRTSTLVDAGCADELLLRKFLNENSFIHTRRTLDQFYYPYEKNTRDRDHDQVVGRYVSEGHFSPGIELASKAFDAEPPILMVDQCWVWAIGSDTVLTAFPKIWNCSNKEADHTADTLDLHARILRTIQRPPHPKIYLKSSSTFARFIIRQSAVNMLEPSDRVHEHEKFLLFFDYAIGRLRQRKTDHLKKLWKRLQDDDRGKDDFLLGTKEEYQMLEEAQDILEELCMIQELVRLQDGTIKRFEKAQNNFDARVKRNEGAGKLSKGSTEKKISMLDRPSIMERREFITRLVQRAKTMNKDVNQLLILKQQQSSIREARYTRTLTEQGSRQGSTIMLFTIVTMFFLPLSTLAAMFGINSKTLGSGTMGLGVVFAYIFPISILSVAFFLLIGLNNNARHSLILVFHIIFLYLKGDHVLKWCDRMHQHLMEHRQRLRMRHYAKFSGQKPPVPHHGSKLIETITPNTHDGQRRLRKGHRAKREESSKIYWNDRPYTMTSMYSVADSTNNIWDASSNQRSHSGRTTPSLDGPRLRVTDSNK